MKRYKLLVIVLIILALVGFQKISGQAQTTLNQVGLVVQFGDGRIETECIQFSEESITGYEVFEHSSFNFTPSFDSGNGWAICRIEENGCPANDCFCYPTLYWSYWLFTEGDWLYSPLGSSNFNVYDGDVQGWRWGEGVMPDEIYSLEEICTPPTATPTSTATYTKTTLPPTATPTQITGAQAVFASDTPVSNGSTFPTNTPLSNPTNPPPPSATATRVPSATQTPIATLGPSQTPLPSVTPTTTATQLLVLTSTATEVPQPEASPGSLSEIGPQESPEPAITKPKQKPSATPDSRQGFQKSDRPAVVLLGGTVTATPVGSNENGAELPVTKLALVTGGLLGYLVFMVLIGGLGFGLIVLLVARRK